jgi:parallel beta-helix repeat protein
VNALSAHTLLHANHADGNGDDGIDVRDTTARLGDNTASSNGDFGIDAVAGVTDLGGNTASGNGNRLKCRNVFCGVAP